ncbi:nucleotidyltransferase family protein [Rossellomorea aquimaris]|uniref:nucleotidyltransferase family protein n=1 Tax=Rossellomorea aquimaris TaxID=189382 RepID=UPI001CD24177|nr:nucleotidyltransferase family protein [Rossellomorea aquimaris]MCA1054344.1 nucleotidyltransferase family protein [Rossellomorea aquimaris]
MLKTEEDILSLIEQDDEMMEILKAAKKLDLPDWWICAGFVRSKIWDALHGFDERTQTPDVDVIYFDVTRLDEVFEKECENELRRMMPAIPWSVKNEARMHVINHIPPYTSSVDAISKFPETATALGVKLDKRNRLVLAAPCGVEDVLNLQLKPTAYFRETAERAAIYEERIRKKGWKGIWDKITVHHIVR